MTTSSKEYQLANNVISRRYMRSDPEQRVLTYAAPQSSSSGGYSSALSNSLVTFSCASCCAEMLERYWNTGWCCCCDCNSCIYHCGTCFKDCSFCNVCNSDCLCACYETCCCESCCTGCCESCCTGLLTCLTSCLGTVVWRLGLLRTAASKFIWHFSIQGNSSFAKCDIVAVCLVFCSHVLNILYFHIVLNSINFSDLIKLMWSTSLFIFLFKIQGYVAN